MICQIILERGVLNTKTTLFNLKWTYSRSTRVEYKMGPLLIRSRKKKSVLLFGGLSKALYIYIYIYIYIYTCILNIRECQLLSPRESDLSKCFFLAKIFLLSFYLIKEPEEPTIPWYMKIWWTVMNLAYPSTFIAMIMFWGFINPHRRK